MNRNELRQLIRECVQEIVTEAEKYQYVPSKGMRFYRYGGLAGTRQKKNLKSPREVASGLWVFPWPYFDWYFLGAEVSDIGGRWKRDDTTIEKQPSLKLNDFWYSGPIFITGALAEGFPELTIKWDGWWHLTHTRLMPRIMQKDQAQVVKWLRKAAAEEKEKATKRYEKRGEPVPPGPDEWLKTTLSTRNPKIAGRFSNDYLEMFIPKHGHELEPLVADLIAKNTRRR